MYSSAGNLMPIPTKCRKCSIIGKHLISIINLIFAIKLFINVSHRSWRFLSKQKDMQTSKCRWVEKNSVHNERIFALHFKSQ